MMYSPMLAAHKPARPAPVPFNKKRYREDPRKGADPEDYQDEQIPPIANHVRWLDMGYSVASGMTRRTL